MVRHRSRAMKCQEHADSITEFMEGQGSRTWRARIALHHLGCRHCRRHHWQLRQTIAAMAALPRYEAEHAPVHVSPALLAIFRERVPLRQPVQRPVQRALAAIDRALSGVRVWYLLSALLLGSLYLAMSGPGGATPGLGLFAHVPCALVEIAAGFVPLVGLLVVGSISASGSVARRHLRGAILAATAGVGAVVAQAILHDGCPGSDVRLHLLGFHFGGVVLAMLIGAASRLTLRPWAAGART